MRFIGFLTIIPVALMVLVEPALAQEHAAGGPAPLIVFSDALALALAAFGGALGQSRIISSALESISRNPGAAGSMFLPWLLGIVFVETLVIYVLLIAAKLL